MKAVLAPMFADRNLHVMSWVGHNIFGNLDGKVLDDPVNKASKVHSKDHLLTDILRHEWGFTGLVVTDWGATHDRVQGIKAGQDLEMPSSGMVNTSKILAAIEDGTLQTDELDLVVGRVLNLILTSKPDGSDDLLIQSKPTTNWLNKRLLKPVYYLRMKMRCCH